MGLMNQPSTPPSPRPLPSRAREKLYVQDMNFDKLYYKKMGNVKYTNCLVCVNTLGVVFFGEKISSGFG